VYGTSWAATLNTPRAAAPNLRFSLYRLVLILWSVDLPFHSWFYGHRSCLCVGRRLLRRERYKSYKRSTLNTARRRSKYKARPSYYRYRPARLEPIWFYFWCMCRCIFIYGHRSCLYVVRIMSIHGTLCAATPTPISTSTPRAAAQSRISSRANLFRYSFSPKQYAAPSMARSTPSAKGNFLFTVNMKETPLNRKGTPHTHVRCYTKHQPNKQTNQQMAPQWTPAPANKGMAFPLPQETPAVERDLPCAVSLSLSTAPHRPATPCCILVHSPRSPSSPAVSSSSSATASSPPSLELQYHTGIWHDCLAPSPDSLLLHHRHVGLYKILLYFEAHVHESILFYNPPPPPPPRIAHTIATLLPDY